MDDRIEFYNADSELLCFVHSSLSIQIGELIEIKRETYKVAHKSFCVDVEWNDHVDKKETLTCCIVVRKINKNKHSGG